MIERKIILPNYYEAKNILISIPEQDTKRRPWINMSGEHRWQKS